MSECAASCVLSVINTVKHSNLMILNLRSPAFNCKTIFGISKTSFCKIQANSVKCYGFTMKFPQQVSLFSGLYCCVTHYLSRKVAKCNCSKEINGGRILLEVRYFPNYQYRDDRFYAKYRFGRISETLRLSIQLLRNRAAVESTAECRRVSDKSVSITSGGGAIFFGFDLPDTNRAIVAKSSSLISPKYASSS